ncbi:MAG: hypothetical protein ACIAS6_00480 [Phycisphaerales bacterium JB060]
MSIDRNGPSGPQLAQPLRVPYRADSVSGPIVRFDSETRTAVHFEVDDGRFGRVVFENLDAIRVCRGEWSPYDIDESVYEDIGNASYHGEQYANRRLSGWVYTVSQSRWLFERYLYEREHYGDQYEFGRDVDEMLPDFRHYVFTFHDEYVEALAKGIWIDAADEPMETAPLASDHPLNGLSETFESRTLKVHGKELEVRVNPKPIGTLVADARLCSQSLIEMAYARKNMRVSSFSPLELEGEDELRNRWRPDWQLSLRYRDGRPISILEEGLFAHSVLEVEGVAGLELIAEYLEHQLKPDAT